MAIRVPALWACAVYDCVLVRCRDDHFFLCSVVVPPYPVAVYSLSTKVRVGRAAAQRLIASQDIAAREEVLVWWLPCEEDGALWLYTVCTTGTGGLDAIGKDAACLNIYSIANTCMAEVLCVSGPRLDTRVSLAHVSAFLLGSYVVAGSVFNTAHSSYEVVQVGKKSAPGLARVGSSCRVKLNDAAFAHPNARLAVPLRPVMLDAEAERLGAALSLAEENPGSILGILVHGPKGCGVRALVDHQLSLRAAQVLAWNTSFEATAARCRLRGKAVVLRVPFCERFFPADECGVARLTLRKLQQDAHWLSARANGHQCSVVVIASTHQLGTHCAVDVLRSFFSVCIGVRLPDAKQRAALLAHVRGGAPCDWLTEAQSLVGKTAAQTLSVARSVDSRQQLFFKEVRWDDIGGLAEVKSRLRRALVWPQRHPEVFERFSFTPPKGILLYGPPGCAKTTLVKALCSEACFSLIYLDSATVVSAYVGESERQLREVFARAAQQAPCIVFFDEVEVLGAKREVAAPSAGGGVRLLSTLLTEMDGFAGSSGVCFVGATNVPHMIDPALLRPGRFDYLVYVPMPAAPDREAILSLCLRPAQVDAAALAAVTEGLSGADLRALCTSALLELFAGVQEGPPPCLSDATWMTSFMRARVAGFQRTPYDSSSLEAFHRERT